MGIITGYDALTTPDSDDIVPIYVEDENLTYKIGYDFLLPTGMLKLADDYTASNIVTDYTLISGKIWIVSSNAEANFAPLPTNDIVFGIWNDNTTTQVLLSFGVGIIILQNGIYYATFITLPPGHGGTCYYIANIKTIICLGMYRHE